MPGKTCFDSIGTIRGRYIERLTYIEAAVFVNIQIHRPPWQHGLTTRSEWSVDDSRCVHTVLVAVIEMGRPEAQVRRCPITLRS